MTLFRLEGNNACRRMVVIFIGLLAAFSFRSFGAEAQLLVTGRVLDSDKVPVPNATITVRTPPKSSVVTSQSPPASSITAVSDEHGLFSSTLKQWSELVIFSVAAASYIPCGNPGTPGNNILAVVPPGTDHVSVDLCVARASQVDGKILDADSGQPISGLQIAAMRQGFLAGGLIFLGRSDTMSSSNGSFLLKGLPPGNYVLRISSEPAVKFTTTAEVAPENPGVAKYGRVYWPSMVTDYPMENETFSISAGSSISLGTISLRSQRLYTLTVKPHEFTCAGGNLLHAFWLSQRDSGMEEIAQGTPPCAPFQVSNIPRGIYRLLIVDSDHHKHASELVEVTRDDRIDINGEPKTIINGKVQIEGLSNDNVLPKALTGVMIFLEPRTSFNFPDQRPSQLETDGTFSGAVFQGQLYSIEFLGLPNNYFVKSVRVGGKELSDLERFTPSGPASMQITLSDRPATFRARAVSGSDVKGPCVFLLVRADLTGSRRVSERIQIRAGDDGVGSQSGLAPWQVSRCVSSGVDCGFGWTAIRT